MITVNEALENISEFVTPLSLFRINLSDAVGYVLAENVVSAINMPPFRQSAMDGYALNNNNTKSYKLIGEVKAGDDKSPELKPGEAIRIFTGAPVPDSANVIVMQEKVIVKDANNIDIDTEYKINDNIRPLGEQVKKGAEALSKGVKLTPAAIGFLASLGVQEVTVYKRPSIAILTTGNEVVESGKTLEYGQIYDSNSIMLLTALQSLGYVTINKFKVKDNYAYTHRILEQAIKNHDTIIVSGGISVGDYDFVGRALKEINVEEVFYKVKQKPGKPLFFGKKDDKVIFALPGNPAAALTCFYVYVYPALQLLSGSVTSGLPRHQKISDSTFVKKGDRAQFLKAFVKGDNVTILEGQSSAMLQTFAVANALVFLPEDIDSINVNDAVEVIELPNI